MKAWFLPIGLVLALIIGLSIPSWGAAAYQWRIGDEQGLSFIALNVMLVFIISGWQMRSSEFEGLGHYLRAVGLAVLCNLIIAPLLVLALGGAGLIPLSLIVGASVMACMPTTLSSGIVISTQAGGDEGLSLLLTVLLSLLGVLVLPFSISLVLDVGAKIDIPIWDLIKKLCIMVLIPFGVGSLIRLKWGRPKWPVVAYIPLTGIIVVVWAVASSKQSAFVGAGLPLIAMAVGVGVTMHLILLLCTFFSSRLLQLPPTYKRSVVIIASQKTLPIAVAVLTIIEGQLTADQLGLGMMICVIWHFGQTIIDSVIAAKWRQSLPTPSSAATSDV